MIDKPNWCEKWTLFLETLGIIGLTVYCVYTYKEWRTFDSERQTMEQEFLVGETNSEKQLEVMQRQIDDSEAQQRAILQFGNFRFKMTNMGTNFFGHQRVKIVWNYDLRNIGFSPAVDLQGYGESFFEGGEWNKITNGGLQKWDHDTIPTPKPYSGKIPTGWVLPQQDLTNGEASIMSELMPGTEDFYCEMWYSYRDIFWHSWIVGEGGHFTLTNGDFTPEFIYNGEYRQGAGANTNR
ncbi:MAG TPA: hypothetical protein VMH87_09325 [Pseudomonadales bacterium]|nr:hypothetical protein [Pseudomonadales bacterium]